jgi:Protein of unknown function (DUF3108)
MILRRASASIRKALLGCAGLALASAAIAAEPPVNLAAHYIVTMTHVRVGEITWAVNFSDSSYLASANGKASGVFSVLVTGEGLFTTHGVIAGGQVMPATARFDVSDDDGVYETEMTFEDGVVKHLQDRGAAPPADRVRVSPSLLRGVSDPLSAMLLPAAGKAMAPANCDRTLRIFDGRRRYNLALSYKRIDRLKLARGYAGDVLVCGVVLRPIAGYRPDSLLVRYLGGKDDLELWFAPIAGLPIMAPVRALMPTLIGTMDIQANEFEVPKAQAVRPAPRPAPTTPVEVVPLAPPKQEPATTKP